MPTLTDVLARYPAIPLIVELKVDGAELARRVIDELRRHDAVARTAVGSFFSGALREARRYEPALRTGAAKEETRWALYRSWIGLPPGKVGFHEFQVPERSGLTTIVSPRFIDCAHKAGFPVKVWTVNEAADMQRLLEWGVDALITDRPDLAVPIVRSYPRRAGAATGATNPK